MGTRSHTTYKKRQKELARQDKQREKAAKRAQRKLEKQTIGSDHEEGIEPVAVADVEEGEELR
jgi:hypothetical protein